MGQLPADAARTMAQPRLLVAHDEAHARERVSAVAGHNHHDRGAQPPRCELYKHRIPLETGPPKQALAHRYMHGCELYKHRIPLEDDQISFAQVSACS